MRAAACFCLFLDIFPPLCAHVCVCAMCVAFLSCIALRICRNSRLLSPTDLIKSDYMVLSPHGVCTAIGRIPWCGVFVRCCWFPLLVVLFLKRFELCVFPPYHEYRHQHHHRQHNNTTVHLILKSMASRTKKEVLTRTNEQQRRATQHGQTVIVCISTSSSSTQFSWLGSFFVLLPLLFPAHGIWQRTLDYVYCSYLWLTFTTSE